MASGDAQRVWFPELIAIVKQAGAPTMSMDALLRLRDRLEATLQTIRQTRQILPAMMWCPHCQARHRAPQRVGPGDYPSVGAFYQRHGLGGPDPRKTVEQL
jgi:hypothetical protein